MKNRLLIIIGLFFFISSVSLYLPDVYGSCIETILPEPCFDSFTMSPEPLTEKSIMEDFARYIEVNYENWQMSNRDWNNNDVGLELPAIICTEFVSDGVKQYRMTNWVDEHQRSDWENHYNPSLCDKWLAPIDDGIKVKWDKKLYESDGIGVVTVIDKSMNLNNQAIDSFGIHVWSDIDHEGIDLTVTETDENTGIFEGMAFFTTKHESSGHRLLVEDAVNADHKGNRSFSRIINEAIPEDIDNKIELVPVQTKTIGDDAPFFGIFVYLDNLISWIFGK